MIGQTISHYRIVERLGGGGMGVVYKAVDTRLNRTVALKFLSADQIRDADAAARFRQEAQSASALDHPNICTVFEIDEAPDGQTFIAMAHYEGETLKQRIERGPLSVGDAVGIARQIAQGLAKAHSAGIVHRDIKPANLIVTTDGIVKILDFGIAKAPGQEELTRTGTTLGTLSYMAPEQLSGAGTDHRVDLWALGAVLHEMLAGQPPFGRDDPTALVSAILARDPAPLSSLRADVPEALQQVVQRALRKPREERYQSASDDRARPGGDCDSTHCASHRHSRGAAPSVADLAMGHSGRADPCRGGRSLGMDDRCQCSARSRGTDTRGRAPCGSGPVRGGIRGRRTGGTTRAERPHPPILVAVDLGERDAADDAIQCRSVLPRVPKRTMANGSVQGRRRSRTSDCRRASFSGASSTPPLNR